jgi:hypothetical protein
MYERLTNDAQERRQLDIIRSVGIHVSNDNKQVCVYRMLASTSLYQS